MAPPAIAIIKRADATGVCFPSLSIAKGQIPGHIKECAKLRRIINTIDVIPFVVRAIVAKTKANAEHRASALLWFIYFGTSIIPIM